MLVSHSLELLPGNLPDNQWIWVNLLLLPTRAATPLFVFVFGMTMAFVYYPLMTTPEGFAAVKRRMWRRCFLVFLSFELLVVVIETAGHSSWKTIVAGMLYQHPGSWIQVLNFYAVVLLIGPWVLRWWRRSGTATKALIVPSLFFLGQFLAEFPVHRGLFVLKNIITGYPISVTSVIPFDSFPLLQLSSFFLVGLTLGEYFLTQRELLRIRSIVRVAVPLILAGLLLSFFITGDTVRDYLKNMATNRYRYPPQAPYVLFGLSSSLLITLCLLWIVELRKSTLFIFRLVALLGRNSLFTFNLQYVLLFTVYGLILDGLHQQSFVATMGHTGIIIGASIVTVLVWERRRSTPTILPRATLT